MMDDILATLNEPQRLAVTTCQGPLLIIAGPGSGKTRVITHRIAYLVRHQQINPWNILAVTFTNKAAREMRERLEKLLGGSDAKTMTVCTFHSLCARVLRHEPDYLARYGAGMTTSFSIYDQIDQLRVVKKVIARVDVSDIHLDQQQAPKPAEILAAISRAKSLMQTPDLLAAHATNDTQRLAARVYPLYNQMLRLNNAQDFDDLLLMTEHLWRSQPERLRLYQQRWHSLHVDEFQDCNLPQYKLIRLLGYGTDAHHEGLGNVCVVGDDDQMIYTWRGASPESITQFTTDFPAARTILLEQNYRSTPVIVEAAQEIVRRNTDRMPKNLWTAQHGGAPIRVVVAADDTDEARLVARQIRRLKERGEVQQWRDIAILYRMNAQSRALEVQLRSALIPYVVIGSHSFYDRKEIRDVLAYLRLLANPNDNASLDRVINTPNRRLGPRTISVLQAWADDHGVSLFETLSHLAEIKLSSGAKQSLEAFRRLLLTLRATCQKGSLPKAIDTILAMTGYQQELVATSSEDNDRVANVAELRRVAEEVDTGDFAESLQLFLEQTALVGGADTMQTGENGRLLVGKQPDSVQMLTLHAAKGLEFPVVVIVGMDENTLPHSRANVEKAQLAEERRLAYVGCTRAMQSLFLYRAERRYLWGETRWTEASRFLDDIPAHLRQDVL